MHDQLAVTDLVTRARDGDKEASPGHVGGTAGAFVIKRVGYRHWLGGADADEMLRQTVWLRLVDELDKIRDPAALPGWLATTTRRECGPMALLLAHRAYSIAC